jgi:hypothetical protein
MNKVKVRIFETFYEDHTAKSQRDIIQLITQQEIFNLCEFGGHGVQLPSLKVHPGIQTLYELQMENIH